MPGPVQIQNAGTAVVARPYLNISGATFADTASTESTDITVADQASAQTLSNKTLSAPVISGGLTASGSASNNFSGSTGAFLTSTGAVTIGSGNVTISGPLVGNVSFLKEANHTLSVATTTTAATVGANLTVSAGTGATSGAGGVMTVTGGVGGATGAGGALALAGGAAGGGAGNGGALSIDGGAKAGGGTDGAVSLCATTGALNLSRSGGTIGFYGVTAAVRPSAFTQTYATATHTHSNLTSAALTDSSGGAVSGTLAAITGGGANCENATKNAIASIAAQVNALIVDMANVKQVVNGIIDDGQSVGLLQ